MTEEELQAIIDYYVNLIIIQYHDKPKAQAHIALLIQEILASGIIFETRDGYDVETAIGVQLDVIGKYVGVNRKYEGFSYGEGMFTFVQYDEATPYSTNKKGFATYADSDRAGEILNYAKTLGTEYRLDDDAYRTLIKLKIIQNNINHSHKSIDESLYMFFGSEVLADSNNNMTMYYFIPKNLSTIVDVALKKGLLPKPMGVNMTYIIRTDNVIFGMATYLSDNTVKSTGFATYDNVDVKEGSMLNYSKIMEAL